MIDLYYYTSPNARKVLMMLEEVELPYRVHWVDITAGAQFAPDFLAINPNGKIPALVDHDGAREVLLFESGAILLYLAEKTGKLLPADPLRKYDVVKWLFWQTSSQGPLLGQAAHFVSHIKSRDIQAQYAVERYRAEAARLYEVLDRQLQGQRYICGAYSIADIAAFPWVRVAKGQGVDIRQYTNVDQWCERIASRPASQKKLAHDAATKEAAKTKYYTDETWNLMFGGRSAKSSSASET